MIYVGVFGFWLRKDSHATKNSYGKEINVTYLAEFGLDFTVKFAKVSVYSRFQLLVLSPVFQKGEGRRLNTV